MGKSEIVDWEKQFKIDFYLDLRENKETSEKIPVLVINPEDRRSARFLCRYYMDFKVNHNDGTIEFVEVKGLEGPDWKMKWTMLESVVGDDPAYKLTVIK
jgi:hypothetical protein